MNFKDIEIDLNLQEEFTEILPIIEKIIKDERLNNANMTIFIPHEVSSIVPIGWEDGLLEDLKNYLLDVVPSKKYKNHDEPNTPFRYNFDEHMRVKIAGTNSITFIIKDKSLYLGKYQNYYFYSPVYKNIPKQKMFIRIQLLD